MARLQCLNSSSAGNCFILNCESEKLVLDLGVEWSKILKGLHYDISNVSGCLVTHVHTDHSKSIPKALSYCLDVYSCREVQSRHPEVKVLDVGRRTRIGGFGVQPIAIKHNVENYGYIITHAEIGKLVFALDCEEFMYKIKDVNHWVIEANNDYLTMLSHAAENSFSASHSENHLSLDQCADALLVNKSDALKTVVLAHLSDHNSDSRMFVDRIKGDLGIENVFVATSSLDIVL